ncbi:ABC transporter substrate-binding protein [Enterococcus sp. LJL120]
MKKKIISGLIVATSVFAMAGCNSESSSSSGGDTIDLEVWTLNTKTKSMDQAIEKFNSSQDKISVTASYFTIDTLKQNLKVAASSNSLPTFWFNYGGIQGEYYQTNEISYNLDEYAATNNWDEKFDSGALELAKPAGTLIGYPISVNALGIYYNKEIFEKYNLTVPTTIEELDQICKTLKENGVTPLATAGKYGWHTMRYIEQFIEYYAGSEIHDELTALETSWDNDAVTKAFEKFQEYVDNGYFPEGFVTADPNDLKLSLYSGDVAMNLEGQWFESQMLGDEQDPEKFGSFYFPSGGTNRLSGFVELFQFSNSLSDEELDAAVEFIDTYFSDENVEANIDEFNLPVPQENGYQIPDNLPIAQYLIDGLDQNGAFTILDQAFPSEVADVLYSCQDAIANGTMEPNEAGSKIQSAIESYKSSQE